MSLGGGLDEGVVPNAQLMWAMRAGYVTLLTSRETQVEPPNMWERRVPLANVAGQDELGADNPCSEMEGSLPSGPLPGTAWGPRAGERASLFTLGIPAGNDEIRAQDVRGKTAPQPFGGHGRQSDCAYAVEVESTRLSVEHSIVVCAQRVAARRAPPD